MNDDLIRFAAEKVGGYIVFDRICLPPKEGEHYCNFASHTLSSPDLFIKGLGVCPYEVYVCKHYNDFECGNYVQIWNRDIDKEIQEKFTECAGISEAFWTAWFKLEKGGA